MKKIAIGGILTLAGTWIVGCIFVAAALYVPNMSSWEGTRVWYAIFGGGTYESDLKQSMALGLPFVVGLIMVVGGLVILMIELFRSENPKVPVALAPTTSTPQLVHPEPQSYVIPKKTSKVEQEEDIPTMKEIQP
ncbi:hypothetical protein [Saccharibacillus sp. JS10]|uniref:hypothetical protein n=1 Tax=Saccharibacillus sp. JS10 TaxID=2950552 RepID=UPI00210E9173|nr:hypothetical protein [Saccharibacillus sp. JS10]MCQ4087059.1 hypothetical protein [Saccharibacillus sp. JS10]